MKLQLFLICLLLPLSAHAQDGNIPSQEVGDVVFRQLDARIPVVNKPIDSHGAIYIGQTNKTGSTPSLPFKHTVIEMTGVTKTNLLGKVTAVNPISYVNFQEFRIAHPHYYGAFTINDPGSTLQVITQSQRKLILEAANALHKRRKEIAYAVNVDDYMPPLSMKLVQRYFAAGTDTEGNQTIPTSYTGDYNQITMMRSDAFVEYCYAAAGVPVMENNLATYGGAYALVLRAAMSGLSPDDQRARMFSSQVDAPALMAKDSSGNEILGETGLNIVTFGMSDLHSGLGLLKIHRAPVDGGYGKDDFPFSRELMKGDQIQTENIQAIVPFPYSPKDGLEEGYYTATAYDHAGNSSQEINFKIPDLSAIKINSANALYDNFKGISETAPSTLERAHSFEFSESVAGVSAVSIDGPSGNLWSQTFDPPVFSTSTSLFDLPTGDYVVKSFNAVGEETKTPFRIGALSVNISTPASAQNYAYHSLLEPGTFYITLHAEAMSPDGLNRLQRIEPSSFTLASDNVVEGNTVSLDIAMPPYPQSAVPGATGLVRAIDNAGNIVNNMFGLQIAAAAVPAYGEDCIESCTQTVSTDVVNSDFLGNPLLVNYGVYNSTSGPYIFVPGRGYIHTAAVSQWVTQNPPSVFDMTMPLSVGTLRGTLRAWGKEDKSDLVEVPAGEYEVFWDLRTPDSPPFAGAVDCEAVHTFRSPTAHLLLCTREIAPNPVLLQDKKYVELQSIYTRTSSEEVPLCVSLNDGSGNDSCAGYAAQVPPLFNNLTSFIGAALAWQTQSPVGQIPSVPAGNHIYMPLGGYGGLVFSTVVAAGNLPATLAATRPPNGYAESPVNSSYKLTPDEALVFEGPVRLTLKYDAQNLTSSQEGKLKLLRVLDPASGKYDELAATVNAVDKTISADITGFSDFVVAAPEHADPHTAQGGSVIGSSELEFLAGVPATAGQYNMGTETGQAVLAALKSADRLPVGNVYQISTATDTFEPSGAIKMRYNAAAPLMLGVEEDSLALYAFNESGALYRLPFLTLDKESKVLTARVPTAEYPLYAVLGSSVQAENIPPSAYPDGIPPESSLAVHGLAVPVGDGIIVSTRTGIVLSGTDPVLPSVLTSGYKLTNYLLNPDESTVDISTFTVPLVSSEGVHALHYFSVDNALNYEFPRGATIYADGTPPVTGLDGDGLYEADGKKYVAAGSSISLNGYDAPSNGVASGHFGTVYLVGASSAACSALAQIVANPQTGPPSFDGVPGTCENPIYTEPFTLEEGTWSVTYFSLDRVWNAEKARADILHVDGTPPVAELKLNGVMQADGASVQASAGDTIVISAEDIISRELASGWATTHMLINITPEACESDGVGGGVNGFGSCENPYYPGPFSLPEGAYAIYYTAADNVGNMSAMKSVTVSVGRKMPFPRAYEFSGKFPINNGYFATRDKDGNTYVASFGEISKYGPAGAFITKWGSSGSGPGQFGSIWAIQAGPDGNIYALDSSNRSIQKFTSGGAYLSTIKGSFLSPQGLDIDKNGNLYVADAGAGQVVVLSTAGVVLRNIAIANCFDVAVDEAGNIYAGDNSNKTIKKFSSEGNLLVTFTMPAGTNYIFSIEIDPYGNVYAADLGNSSGSKIVVFSPAGAYVGEFGSAATTPGGAIAGNIAKMELDEEDGRLYIPQVSQVFIYKAMEAVPAAPSIVSPTGNTAIYNNQVLVYLQAGPGQKVELFDGDILAASGYVDNVEGGFSATLSLAAGPHTLSAKVKSNLGFDSDRTAVANVAVQSLRAPAFSQAVSIPVRGYPYSQVIATTTVAGDFNGDNVIDIVAIGKYSYTVLLGRGDGNFDEQLSVNYESYNWGGSPGAIEVWEAVAEDVNKDGKLDFVMTSLGRVLTAVGYGDGTFRLVDSGYVPSCSTQYILDTDFRVGDVNNDGYPDVVKSVRTAAISGGSCIYVLLGAGDGKFNLSSTKAGLSANGAVDLQDFNQDGALDIANGQGIFWNDGSGTFGNYQEMCPNCVKAVSADINSDGLFDLIYDFKYIRFNLGHGKFSRPVTWSLNWQNNWIIGKPVISDFNGDSVPDLAVGVGSTWDSQGKVFVYPGYGDGRFAPEPISLYVGNNYSQIDTISVADFNSDTRNDIIAALHFNIEYLTPEIAFFYNNTLVPDVTPPAASVIVVSPDPEGGVKVSWGAAGDDGSIGKANRYDLRFAQAPIMDDNAYASAERIAGVQTPKTAGTSEAFVVNGLTGGVTHYFALKTVDEIGNTSGLSNSPGLFVYYLVKSTQSVDGKAEFSVISKVSPELANIDATVGVGAAGAQAAVSQDLSPVGNVYGVGFGPEYDYSGVLTFRYSAAALSVQGLLENEIGLYEYSEGAGWARLEGQNLDAADQKIIAPINSTSTMCGVFGSSPRLLSPVDNAVLYSEAPLFIGRICENCSLKVYEAGVLQGELLAQAGGFVSGSIGFLPGAHEIEAVLTKDGLPQPTRIYRKFTVKSPFALAFDEPVMTSTDTRYNVGSGGLGVADFNGDSHDDLLVFGGSGYVTALGNGAGQFTYLTPVYVTLNHVFRVENPDLNRDGKADIVGGNLYRGLLGAYGSGNGTFGGFITLPNELSVSDSITYGDFNKDGNIDLAVAGYNSTTGKRVISLLKGQGGASFTRKHIERPASPDGSVKFAEMDADNNTDLVHGGTVLYGDGQGNFPGSLTVDPNCTKSLLGDFNGDDNKDIACIRTYSNSVDIYVSLKNRTFKKIQSIEFPTSPAEAAAAADMNNDGLDDLVFGSYSGKLYVVTSRGDGTFTAPFTISLDSRIGTVKIVKTGDFNEDGKKDLAIGHYFAPISPQAVSLVYNRSEGIDRIPPATVSDLAVSYDGISGAPVLTWTAPGDDGMRGQAASYDLRFAAVPVTNVNFGQAGQAAAVPAPGASDSSETFTVEGLPAGVTYYFALKTADEAGNVSDASNSPGLFVNFIARSTNVVDGNTEVSMVSPVQPYIAQISTVSAAWTVAIGSASAQSLTIGSNMFEIAPEGDYNPPATLTFYYSTAALAAVGLTEDDVFVYEHFAGTGWVKLEGQVKDTLNHKITVPITRIASLFGIFGMVKDRAAPATDYAVYGGSWPYNGGVYISTGSSIVLNAYDPVVFATSSGVAYTEFRVDASSAAPFAVYLAPIRVSTGAKKVEFRSVDNAGNIEETQLLNVIVDDEAPAVVYGVSGKSFPGNGIVYATAGSSVTLVSSDTAAGVAMLFYEVNRTTYSSVSAEAVVHLSSAGFYGVAYNAEDNVGNIGGKHSVSLYVDTAAPRTDIFLSGISGSNGWYISPVAASLVSLDGAAGVEQTRYRLDGSSFAVYAATFPVLGEGAHVLEAYATDNVGNMEDMRAAAFKIDCSTPVVSYSLSPNPNAAGWNNAPVDVVFSGTDAVSGLAYCSSSFTVSGEGLGISVTGYCMDYAGWSSTASVMINIDTTGPSIGYAALPAANEAGWNNEDVTLKFSCEDALSGVGVCPGDIVLTQEGIAVSTSVLASDNAGNLSAIIAAGFKVDKTAPVIGFARAPLPNEAGWNNSAVTIGFSCSDELSGVDVCPGDIRLAGEGVSISTSASTYDFAGNISTTGVSGIKIDLAASVSTAALAGVYRNGWYSSQVEVVIASTDALSGVKEIMYSLDGEAYAVYSMPLNVSGDGEHSLKYYAVDNAGNVEAVKSVEFKIDTSLPEIAYTQVPGVNARGWNNSSVQVVFTGSDTLSGIEECSSATITTEGAAQRVPGWCRDVAGNVAYATATVNVDLTPAVIELNSPLAGQTYIATRGKIGVDFAVTDNLDPAPGAEAFLVQVEDRGSPCGARAARVAVVDGQFIEPLDLDDGLWRLTMSATDFADNAAYLEGGAFEVIHDVLAPRSAVEAAGPVYNSADGTYLTSAAQFELRSNDDLVAAADGLGLGVRSQEVKLIAGELPLKELSFQNPQPRQGAAFVSTFSFISLRDLPDGRYRLSYAAEDILANKERYLDWAFALDNTPPFTTFGVTGAAFNGEDRVFVTGLSGLSLAGVDVSSGGVASGLLLTKYKLDDGAWQVYAGSFTIVAEGRHTLAYYSIDNVQNSEQQRTRVIIVDNTAPAASLSLGEPRYEVFGLQLITPGTPVSLAAGDPGADASGVKAIYYELTGADGWSSGLRAYLEPFKIGRQGTFLVRYWAVDNVGNLGAAKEEKLRVSDLRGDALNAAEGLDMTGTAEIAGAVRANGVVSLGGNTRILGDVWASTITLSGKAQITGQAHNGSATLTPAPLEMADIVAIASATNNNALIPAKYLIGGKLVVSSKDTLTLSTGVYYLAGLELAGGAVVNLDGKVDILVAGAVSIGGGSTLNAAGASSGLNVFLSTDSAVTVLGGGCLVAYVYAPYSHMKLAGNALLGGHFFVKTAAVSGTGNIIQSGETLPKTASAAEDTGGKKRVSALAAGDTAYSVLSGPDPAFRLGEVYVYPNPALRGAAPVLHIETGIADRVKISIYTVSGRQAHEHTLTGMPVALDDGNGLSYAYEYAWRDSVPSGVYYYHIEAEKGGQKIRKSGKFAVVR